MSDDNLTAGQAACEAYGKNWKIAEMAGYDFRWERAAQAAIQADPVRKRLADVLMRALPYVECSEWCEGYKSGQVRRMVNEIRAALAETKEGES